MVSSRRNITQATAVVPAAPKGKGKTIEVPEPVDCQPILSDVNIFDAGDSHSNPASPCGTQAGKLNLGPTMTTPPDAFYSAEADGGPANRDNLTLRGCCS